MEAHQSTKLFKSMMKAQKEMLRIYKYYRASNEVLKLFNAEAALLGLQSVDDKEILSDLTIAKMMADRVREILTIESGLE